MRIGEITQDNYAQYMRMFGAKDTKALDKLYGKGENAAEKDYSFEAREKRMVEMGYILEGTLVREGDESRKKTVDVPDSVKQAMIDARRQAVIETHDGKLSAASGDREGKIIHDYIKTLKPSERLSASWTLQKAAQEEGGRIGDYLLSKMPKGWYFNGNFDPKILTETNWGLDDPAAKRVDVAV